MKRADIEVTELDMDFSEFARIQAAYNKKHGITLKPLINRPKTAGTNNTLNHKSYTVI